MKEFNWPNGCTAALSLTYDDGLPGHVEYVAPLLEEYELRATFYAWIIKDPMHNPSRWAELAKRGHELGNHSVFHPCRKDPERGFDSWLDDVYDLRFYNKKRFKTELELANLILHLLDGKNLRSYGNNCCDTTFGSGENEESMDQVLSELFIAARGPWNNKPVHITKDLNLMQLGHFSADHRSFIELKDEVKGNVQLNGWSLYMIHGVGKETYDLHIEREHHEEFIAWLAEQKGTLWVAPVAEIAKYINDWQSTNDI